MRKTVARIGLAVLALLALVGADAFAQKAVVAMGDWPVRDPVINWGNVTPGVKAAQQAAFVTAARDFASLPDRIKNALVNTRKFEVVDLKRVGELVKTHEVTSFFSQTADPDETTVDLKPAAMVIRGSALKFSCERRGGLPRLLTEIQIELTDAVSGRSAESAVVEVIRIGRPGEQYPNLCGQALQELARRAANKIVEFMFPIKVLKVSADGKVYINVGAARTRPGAQFNVYAVGEALVDPDTGERLGGAEKIVGRVEVRDCKPKYSICAAVPATGGARMSKGMICRLPSARGEELDLAGSPFGTGRTVPARMPVGDLRKPTVWVAAFQAERGPSGRPKVVNSGEVESMVIDELQPKGYKVKPLPARLRAGYIPGEMATPRYADRFCDRAADDEVDFFVEVLALQKTEGVSVMNRTRVHSDVSYRIYDLYEGELAGRIRFETDTKVNDWRRDRSKEILRTGRDKIPALCKALDGYWPDMAAAGRIYTVVINTMGDAGLVEKFRNAMAGMKGVSEVKVRRKVGQNTDYRVRFVGNAGDFLMMVQRQLGLRGDLRSADVQRAFTRRLDLTARGTGQ